MSHLTKYMLEFPINSSPNMLYRRLSTTSGLSEWFADDVIIKNKLFTFSWEGSNQKAKLLKSKTNQFIRFKWEEDDDIKEKLFVLLVFVLIGLSFIIHIPEYIEVWNNSVLK